MPLSDRTAENPEGIDSIWPDKVGWFDFTLPTLVENLALDEALLESVNEDPSKCYLRFWEATHYGVVVGRSNRVDAEVELNACRAESIPVIRRPSGGGTVVVGPGCLAFSLVLPLSPVMHSMGLNAVTRNLMNRIATGLADESRVVTVNGTSDLVHQNRKFSGNAQRWLKNAFLHHGTLLFNFDLPLISRLLKTPARQPEYREGRDHAGFVANFEASKDDLFGMLIAAWRAKESGLPQSILLRTKEIVADRYSDPEWLLQ